ncbi:alpha/beta fold hydrolase [Streptomyces sp. SHP 1-2]|uniref:alpha/beta fold hydrolase n=1 Tax=Streptomyces sp. SHP 1-2 TaxID=2769489 RepID=UPI0022378093|nr:alpha/beta hydrolase [Streptomyces sp. SHP 1-2]MCW5251319.1 alpha/beta fold hydrolase [Streptomyces sp. SHP 1-2]
MTTTRTVTTGTGLRVDTAGEHGTPVLLLHGIGSAAASFAGQLPALARHHRAAAWDAPGYARSDDPPTPYRMDDFADAAAAVLTGLGPPPAHVVGVSWGGVVATRLALRHPHLLRSLVLVGSTRGSGRDPAAARAMLERGGELAALGAREFARTRAPRLLSDRAPASAVGVVRDLMARSVRLPGYAEAAASMAETDHTGALPTLRMPTLVLVGEHDRVTGVAESEHIHRLVPGSAFAVIPGAGHLANQERPDLFLRLLEGFLADVDARPGPAADGPAPREDPPPGRAATADGATRDKERTWTSD